MPDHAGQCSHHAPLVLPENRERKLRVMAYDLFMFVQLVMFHVLCATLGLACYLLDRITFGTRFIDAFIALFDKMSRLGHKS